MKTALGLAMVVFLSALVWAGCDVGSPDTVIRGVSVNVEGYYAGQLTDGRLTSQNTGAPVTSLNLRQNGEELEAVDNNGIIFRGRISGESSSRAPFTLAGTTSAGQAVTISGAIAVNGTSGSMSGTWIEPTLYGTIQAVATVSTNSNSGTSLALSPAGPVTMGTSGTQTFTVSGGAGSYAWSLSASSLGSLNSSIGASVVYTASGTGSQTITVTDSSSTATAHITQE